jgi:hypothetical protein
VLEHVDEPRGNLHCLVGDEGRAVKPFMAGHKAENTARESGVTDGQKLGEAYRLGYEKMQDWFHDVVGKVFGLARISMSPQPRLQHAAWKLEARRKVVAEEALAVELDKAKVARLRQETQDMLDEIKHQAYETALLKSALTPVAALAIDDEVEKLRGPGPRPGGSGKA